MDNKILNNSNLNSTDYTHIPNEDLRNISLFNIYSLEQSIAQFSKKGIKSTRKSSKKSMENLPEVSSKKEVSASKGVQTNKQYKRQF